MQAIPGDLSLLFSLKACHRVSNVTSACRLCSTVILLILSTHTNIGLMCARIVNTMLGTVQHGASAMSVKVLAVSP